MTEQKRKIEKLAGVKGMNDILPQDAGLWEFFEATVKSLLRVRLSEHPHADRRAHAAVHARHRRSHRHRREGDVLLHRRAQRRKPDAAPGEHRGVVRAAIEHNLLYDGPKRLWYIGPMFRHERPQRGRYRQFHQVGVEALGFAARTRTPRSS
jgi:histidyl-tRNA synthetase